MYILGPHGSLDLDFFLLLQPPQVFSVRGFEALFLCIGTLRYVVWLAPQLSLLVYPHANVGPPATALPAPSSSHCLAVCPFHPSCPSPPPPTSLDECFFFNSLVVRLPYSSIFWQFWLIFVFEFVVVLFLVVGRGKVYLLMPPFWPEGARCLILSYGGLLV